MTNNISVRHIYRRLLLASLGLTFVALIVLVCEALKKSSESKWAKFSPPLTEKIWSENNFVAIENSANFRQQLLNRIQLNLSPEVQSRASDIANLESEFLVAYSQGDFESFYKFRFPTGEFKMKQGTEAQIRAILFAGSHQNEGSLEQEELIRKLWEFLSKKGVTASNNRSYRFCTNCYAGIAIDSLVVSFGSDLKSNSHLDKLMKAGLNMGVSETTGLFQAEPDIAAATQDSESGSNGLVLISVIIQLRNGFAYPTYLEAYWDSTDKCYLPFKIAVPVSTEKRALIVF
jgi:hypothetical protein